MHATLGLSGRTHHADAPQPQYYVFHMVGPPRLHDTMQITNSSEAKRNTSARLSNLSQ